MKDIQQSDGNSQADGGPPQCGTHSTPPCPLALVHQERNRLIYQVAGTRTERARVERAARVVDTYLVNVLRSAREIARAAQEGHATSAGVEMLEIDIDADVELR
jgi:hypothetical protein